MAKIKGYSLLNNVVFLYFIVIVFVLNLGIFIYIKDNQSIFLIACSAIIVYLFNHNMIIVLLLTSSNNQSVLCASHTAQI